MPPVRQNRGRIACLEIDGFAVQSQGICRAQSEDVDVLGFALGDQVGKNDGRRVGAVGEGDFLNALVLQIAQRPERTGENGTVGTGRQGQNAVRGFRLVLQRAAIQVELPSNTVTHPRYFES